MPQVKKIVREPVHPVKIVADHTVPLLLPVIEVQADKGNVNILLHHAHIIFLQKSQDD